MALFTVNKLNKDSIFLPYKTAKSQIPAADISSCEASVLSSTVQIFNMSSCCFSTGFQKVAFPWL